MVEGLGLKVSKEIKQNQKQAINVRETEGFKLSLDSNPSDTLDKCAQ